MMFGFAADEEKELEAAFLSAYDQYADALFRHCMIRVRDREAAKDVVQETFARTWLYLADRNEVTYMRAFLYRIANNLIVDQARRKKAVSLEAMMENDGFEPEDEARETRDVVSLDRALVLLATLDETYRSAVTMRYVDGMSPKEIALVLGLTENAVSVRIHRGIERLSRLMRARE